LFREAPRRGFIAQIADQGQLCAHPDKAVHGGVLTFSGLQVNWHETWLASTRLYPQWGRDIDASRRFARTGERDDQDIRAGLDFTSVSSSSIIRYQ
jgi:hypothetical protein